MWTTTDGYVLRLPRPVLRQLALRTGATEGEVMSELERGASRAQRIGSFRARKMGRTYPVFRAQLGKKSFDMVTRPIKGARPIPGPRGLGWGPPYAIVGVSDGFADPDDADPAVPDDDMEPAARPTRSAAPPGWRGPLPFAAAARLAAGGVYIVEDANGQPVYVGQTASFARRMAHLVRRFPRHRVRVMRIVRPPVDVLGAVGDAVVRAVRGAPPRGASGVLPAGHRYGATLPAGRGALHIERTVRTLRAIPRQALR